MDDEEILDDEEAILLLPHLDECGYEILLDEEGNEVLDDDGEFVIAGFSCCMQTDAVDFDYS
jgi:hypothetical protein